MAKCAARASDGDVTSFRRCCRVTDLFLCLIVTQGDIQQLLIDDDPRAAETYCQDYIPDCDAPLPYNSVLTETEEVSPPNSRRQRPRLEPA